MLPARRLHLEVFGDASVISGILRQVESHSLHGLKSKGALSGMACFATRPGNSNP